MQLKTGPKVVLTALVIGGALFGAKFYFNNYGKARMASVTATVSHDVSEFQETETSSGTPAELTIAGTEASSIRAAKLRMLILAWNAQMGLALANGGVETTKGSLMEKHGVRLSLERQDDYAKMKEAMLSCATELSQGKKVCTTGANFIAIMGDAGAAFLAGLNAQLEKLGPQYKAEIIGSAGRSFGEDKWMTSPEVKADPQKMRGLLISGVLQDGDWNIALFASINNGVCNNPDVTTYDPDCINWVGTSSFGEAGEKYIQGYCEDRPVVSKGRKTGAMKNVCVKSVVTWTPGDVTIAKKKGGLVSFLSTRENGAQMPNVIIGIKSWNEANREMVQNLLAATLEGGDQVKRGGSAALKAAAAVSAKIYKEENAAYWMKYYRGVEEADATGELIQLGGSRVFNLADNLRYFGVEDGSANAYEATYTTFGDIVKANYPNDLPSYPALTEVLNTSYLQALAASGTVAKGVADTNQFEDAPATSEVIAKRAYKITFDSGKSTFTSEAAPTLDQVLKNLVIADNTNVEIHGNTDNTGTAEGNVRLSEGRAFAVKKYLEQHAPANFPQGRIKVYSHGQDAPVASNDTPEGRAANRRVEIVLKSN